MRLHFNQIVNETHEILINLFYFNISNYHVIDEIIS